MRQEIRFLLGHDQRRLRSVDPTMIVLDYLRIVEGLVGTKEGCNEGDCGACSVVRAKLVDGALRYEAVNACIQFVGTLDGCQLLTVAHLAEADGTLHPDFSDQGEPIVFGFRTSNYHEGSNLQYRWSGIDNWRVTIHAGSIRFPRWRC